MKVLNMKKSIAILIINMVLFGLAGIASAGDIEDVRARVYAWSNAWQNRNISRYMYFYSPTFQSKGFNYKGWMEEKAKHFQKSGDIRIGISDLWVFIEGNYATARFLQRYQDTKYADVGEKTLVLINTSGQWKIVSEEWKPLKSPTGATGGKRVDKKLRGIDTKTQAGDKAGRDNKIKGLPTAKIVVKSIKFNIENDREKVFVALNSYSIPKVMTLNGGRPRVVVDVKNVFSWKGLSTIPVNGKLIKQIRTHFHHDAKKLRIVLDLTRPEDNIINKSFNKAENIFCVEVR
jgi:ketosteroid isomerase-like protein